MIVDKETGVNYLFIKAGYGAGLTPLLDADGKVVIGGSSTRTGYIYMAIAMLDMVRKQYGVSDDEIVKIVQTFFGSRKKA